MAEQDLETYGSTLRGIRKERGLSLKQISSTTKISVAALEALENGDLEKLPGGIFTRSFVRAYASEVGLDPDETVRTFLSHARDREMNQRNSGLQSQRLGDEWYSNGLSLVMNRSPFVLAVLILCLLALFLLGIGFDEDDQNGTSDDDQVASEVGREVPLRSEMSSQKGTASDFGEPESSPVEFLEVVITPTGDCWISAVLDEERRVSRLLRANERQFLEAKREISLTVGDARVCGYEVNGQRGKPLGGNGEVVSVTIDMDNFRTFIGE